jgi:hypothetical protein
LGIEPWIAALREKLVAGAYPVTLFGENEDESCIRVWCILGDTAGHVLWLTSTRMGKHDAHFPSLANDFPAVNYFECELFEQTGIVPEYHPWLRPVRTADNWKKNDEAYEFYLVKGEEVHEVAVGPVHAGVIEPAIFGFSAMASRPCIWKSCLATSAAGRRPSCRSATRPSRSWSWNLLPATRSLVT